MNQTQNQIKDWLESGQGVELKKIILREIAKLENIHHLKDVVYVDLATEILAAQKASKVLRNILDGFVSFEQETGSNEADNYHDI